MNGISVLRTRPVFGIVIHSEILSTIDSVVGLQEQANALRKNLKAALNYLAGMMNQQESSFMLRNKWGLTKKDAQKIFNDIHDNGSNENKEKNAKPTRPETIDEKVSMIMDYMKETSQKLDSIDRDILELKKQVEEILKRI